MYNIDLSRLSVLPEKHELNTAEFFAAHGKKVIFLKPSFIPGVHTPDFRMDGVEWEVKSPVGNSRRTIENNLRKAMMQSPFIIFDLRRCSLDERYAIRYLQKAFEEKRQIKKLLIITKENQLIEKQR